MDDKKVNMLAKQLRKDYPEAWEVFDVNKKLNNYLPCHFEDSAVLG